VKRVISVGMAIIIAFFAGVITEKKLRFLNYPSVFFENINSVEIPEMPNFTFGDCFRFNSSDYWSNCYRHCEGDSECFCGPAYWKEFEDEFGDIEEKAKDSSILFYKTIGPSGSSFKEAMEELGGEGKVITTFSQICYLIKKQKKGEKGPLAVDFHNPADPKRLKKNIFFVRNSRGTTYPIEVMFYHNFSDCWEIVANFYGKRQGAIAKNARGHKHSDLMPGDVVFYPKPE